MIFWPISGNVRTNPRSQHLSSTAPFPQQPTAPPKKTGANPGETRFQGAQGVISGLETLDYPAVLVGQAMTNYEETEWTKKNVMQVNSVTRQEKNKRWW